MAHSTYVTAMRCPTAAARTTSDGCAVSMRRICPASLPAVRCSLKASRPSERSCISNKSMQPRSSWLPTVKCCPACSQACSRIDSTRFSPGLVQVSAIVYANPDWRQVDGGQLRIWAPLGSVAAARHSSNDSNDGATFTSPSAFAHINGAVPDIHAANYAALLECALGDGGAGNPFDDGTPHRGSRGMNGVDADTNAHLEGGAGASDDVQWTVVDGELVTDIEPIAGRLVLMLSGAVDHAVLPSFASRVALTAWCQ